MLETSTPDAAVLPNPAVLETPMKAAVHASAGARCSRAAAAAVMLGRRRQAQSEK